MFKLIRDKIPEQAKETNSPCNYAICQTDALYETLFYETLTAEINSFLADFNPAKLPNIVSMFYILTEKYGITRDALNEAIKELDEQSGKFDAKYIGFFTDTE